MTRPLLTQTDRADVFRGLAHPLRRQVLAMLRRRGERTVGDLLDELKVTWPALSQHLAVLRECGLVLQRKAGHHRFYRLQRTALRHAHSWLQSNA